MNEKLIELENELILVFPARLQKDPVTKIQFKENLDYNFIDFVIKSFNGIMIVFRVTLVDNKFYEVQSKYGLDKFKKIKDIIKYVEKICGLR